MNIETMRRIWSFYGVMTGHPRCTWGRTEERKRRALHSHTLTWNKRRRLSAGYDPRPAIPRRDRPDVPPALVLSGAAPATPRMNAEDDVYYRTETARVLAELVRPLACKDTGHGRERLLWAFLLRAIQTQLYIHACTALYCLHKRATCRFFFPWKEQAHQQYDETTNRLALQRRHAPDDQCHSTPTSSLQPSARAQTTSHS